MYDIPWSNAPKVASVKCFKMTSDGVPLECEGRIGFGSQNDPWQKSLAFDCSFLMPFRQTCQISMIGKDGILDQVITLDDFVIPRSESEATYLIERLPKAALANHATLVLGSKIEVNTNCCIQEMKMLSLIHI